MITYLSYNLFKIQNLLHENEQLNLDLEEIFSDQYDDLKLVKKQKTCVLEIYIRKNSLMLLIEKFNFKLTFE